MSINNFLNAKRFSKSSVFIANGSIAYDADAEAYLSAVESADGQKLELEIRQIITKFVLGCKSDNIWTAIKACCMLCGARTLSGALVPLIGAAPTNTNFVSADYNRKNGLIGNRSSKWLNSNRNNNADPQNNQHMCCYATSASTGTADCYMGAGPATNETGATNFGLTGSGPFIRSRNTGGQSAAGGNGFFGISRSSSTSYNYRGSNTGTSFSVTSQTPFNANLFVFSAGSSAFPCNARLIYYSIGTSINISLLESRLNTVYSSLQVATLS